MKMRRFFVLALAAMGAAAAFSSCQKDENSYNAPKVEFRDADNKVITEFSKESFGATDQGITVVVTLGDASISLSKLEVSVLADGKTIKPAYEVKTVKGNGGDVNGKPFATIKLADLNISEGDFALAGLKIVAKATDSKKKDATQELKYKAGSSVTPSKGTPMAKENTAAYVNHALGTGTGAYSFSGKKAVSLANGKEADMEFVNTSTTVDFKANFNSKTGFQFIKVNGKVKYETATTEEVAELLKGAKSDKLEGLVENDLFVAVAKDGLTYYLVQVTKVETGKFDYKDGSPVESVSTKGHGYMTFKYKSNK
ncbi:MAG: hypothetical protein HG459_002200 [Bacteroidia bacterium]|nr:hypothetical protein [Bacteroidia bacterium]